MTWEGCGGWVRGEGVSGWEERSGCYFRMLSTKLLLSRAVYPHIVYKQPHYMNFTQQDNEIEAMNSGDCKNCEQN